MFLLHDDGDLLVNNGGHLSAEAAGGQEAAEAQTPCKAHNDGQPK